MDTADPSTVGVAMALLLPSLSFAESGLCLHGAVFSSVLEHLALCASLS